MEQQVHMPYWEQYLGILELIPRHKRFDGEAFGDLLVETLLAHDLRHHVE